MLRRRDRRARESVGSYTAGNPEVRTETGPHPRNRDVSTLESHTYNIKRACDTQAVPDIDAVAHGRRPRVIGYRICSSTPFVLSRAPT